MTSLQATRISGSIAVITGTSFTQQLNTKQDILNPSTILYGIGSNITNINYNNIYNSPDFSQYISVSNLVSYI